MQAASSLVKYILLFWGLSQNSCRNEILRLQFQPSLTFTCPSLFQVLRPASSAMQIVILKFHIVKVDNLSREYKQTSATLETSSTCSAALSRSPGWWGWKWDWRGEASPEEGRPHPYTAGLQPWLLSCGEGENRGREERPSLDRALRVWPSRMESDCLTSSLYGGRQAGKK